MQHLLSPAAIKKIGQYFKIPELGSKFAIKKNTPKSVIITPIPHRVCSHSSRPNITQYSY